MKQLLGLLFLIGFIGLYFWWIVAIAAVAAAVWFGMRAWKASEKRAVEAAKVRAAVARRADQQHGWALSGDDRGVFGPDLSAVNDFRRVCDRTPEELR